MFGVFKNVTRGFDKEWTRDIWEGVNMCFLIRSEHMVSD